MLYVLNFMTEDNESALDALEVLNERWPSDHWSKALEGMRAQLEAQ